MWTEPAKWSAFSKKEFLALSVPGPREIARYLIEKGSVAVDGISLTVAEIEEPEFAVAVIPHTAQTTTLGEKKAGTR